MNSFSKIWLAGLLLMALASSALAQDPLETKKKKIQQLQFEREQISKQLSEFKESEGELLGDVRLLTRQIRHLKARETELRRQRTRQSTLARKNQKEIAGLQAKINQLQGQASQHITRIYRFTKLGESASLLTLARNREFFKDAYILARAARMDMTVVKEFQDTREKLNEKKISAEKTLENIRILEMQLQAEKQDLADKERALKADLGNLRSNRKAYRKYLTEIEDVKQGMETAVVSMERRAVESAPSNAPDPLALRGKLSAPAKGKLMAGFGDQDPRYAMKKFQRGVVVKVEEDTVLHAVAPGRSLHAGPFRGYQQLIVLDHGKGLFSVYGHLEKLEISRGQRVGRGARLGSVAYQPTESAYHYYFEIRHNGKPVDPMKWLEKNPFNR